MSIVIRITMALLFSLLYPCLALALSVEPKETLVDKGNADHIGISVAAFEDGLECGGLQDIYVYVPPAYKDSELKSVMMKGRHNNQTVLETSLRILTFQDYKGFKEFHGVNICLEEKSFDNLNLILSYGRGEVTTEVLFLPLMNFI